jgi:hypothetical protein
MFEIKKAKHMKREREREKERKIKQTLMEKKRY